MKNTNTHTKTIPFLCLLLLLTLLCGCSVSASSLTMVSTKRTAALTQQGEAFWEGHRAAQTYGTPQQDVTYGGNLSYALQYPETGNEAVDARIRQIVTERRDAFLQEYQAQAGAEAVLLLGYETYLTDSDQLSLVWFEAHQEADAPTPDPTVTITHFNLTSGAEVAAEELMWAGFAENAAAYCTQYFTETEPYQNGIFGNYRTLLAPESGRYTRFALTEAGVLFYFDRYDLFPGSYGAVTLTIPYEKMRAALPAPQTEEAALDPTIDPTQKLVALTFDDGPNPTHTNAILDTLEQYGAKATFFDLGSLVEKYPDVVRREEALGCETASHSYAHKNFNKLSNAEIKTDMQQTEAAFQKALGHSPSLFRPPYGACDTRVAQQIDLPICLWSVDTLDWKSRDAAEILKVIRAEGDLDGKVILMHGIYGATAEAVAQLVPQLQAEGYQLVTVSELIAARHGETPQAGKTYGYSYFQ